MKEYKTVRYKSFFLKKCYLIGKLLFGIMGDTFQNLWKISFVPCLLVRSCPDKMCGLSKPSPALGWARWLCRAARAELRTGHGAGCRVQGCKAWAQLQETSTVTSLDVLKWMWKSFKKKVSWNRAKNSSGFSRETCLQLQARWEELSSFHAF